MSVFIQLHPDDDVVIARQQLISGSLIESLPVRGLIPPGHKVAVRSLAAGLRAGGVAVWVCLLSPDVPLWFDNEGGFTDDRTARHWWPRWVEAAAGAFGDDVDGWVPFEAPFAMANRLVPTDPRKHGEVVDTLLVAWRDAWRILRGPLPVATSLDVRAVTIPRDDVVAAQWARREEHLRWHTWLRALRDGTITIQPPGSTQHTQVGTLQVAQFNNPAGLESRGENLYTETPSSGAPNLVTPGTNGAGVLLQGYVETSNVNVVEELVNMIQTQRAYEINSKAINTADQMLQRLGQL